MRATTTTRILLTIIAGLALAGCLQTGREEVAAAASDDDAYCQRQAGPPGSDGYAACMKDRDVQRSQSQARMDRSHRRVSEDMLNGR
jgi:hypothetical protein